MIREALRTKVGCEFLKKNGPNFTLKSESTFKEWMKSKEVFPFDPIQLTLTDDMIKYAYAMYTHLVRRQNREIKPDPISSSSFDLTINGITIELGIDERGLSILKALLSGKVKLLKKLEDFWTPKLLNVYYDNGKLKILDFRAVDERELNRLFLSYGAIYFSIQYFEEGPYMKERILDFILRDIKTESPYLIKLEDGFYSAKVGYTIKFKK